MNDDDLRAVDRALRALVRGRRAARLHRAACRAAGLELDPPGFFVLSLLADKPTRLTDLADRIGLDASTVSRKLQDLDGAGLTTRELDRDDRRATLVGLSPHGKRVVRRIEQARLAYLDDVLADWPAAERHDLARLLSRFADDLANRGAPAPAGAAR